MMKHVFAFLLLLAACGCSSLFGRAGPTTGILGAFDAEVELLKSEMEDSKETVIMGIPFFVGTLKGRRIALAETGVGKVNAAVTTTLLIEHFRPEEILFTGIAGGINPTLKPGDIVVGLTTAQHDYAQVNPDGLSAMPTRNQAGMHNPLFFPSDSRLCKLAKEAGISISLEQIFTGSARNSPSIVSGVIVSGDTFISDDAKKKELRERFRADAVEMEGAAVAQVCYQNKTPFVIIRCLSDKADRNASEDIKRFYRTAALNSAKLVMRMVEMLADPAE